MAYQNFLGSHPEIDMACYGRQPRPNTPVAAALPNKLIDAWKIVSRHNLVPNVGPSQGDDVAPQVPEPRRVEELEGLHLWWTVLR